MKALLGFAAVTVAFFVVSAALSDRPAIRKALAQCQMDRRGGMEANPAANSAFLEVCMQSKGFATAPKNASAVPGQRCEQLPFPSIEAECYQADAWYNNLGR